jgi:hypothetical protein
MKQIKDKQTQKPFSIEGLPDIVPWVYIQERLYTPDYMRFLEWMKGQTETEEGVYLWDLKRFLNGGDSFRH